MKKVSIGIAQMKISQDKGEVLCAPNLGSCLGISAYDRQKEIGAMIHCLLPLSKSDPEKAKEKPWMYVDTGVADMLNQLIELGCNKNDIEIVVAGGAQINDTNNVFEIGKKNFTILRKILWKNNLLIYAQDIGNNYPRTLSLHIDSGDTWLNANGNAKKFNKGDGQ